MRARGGWILAVLLAALPATGAEPADGPPAISFAQGVRETRSLLTLTGDAFVIDVTIGGRGPYPFALDTGGTEVLDVALARELGLVVGPAEPVQGAGVAVVEAGRTVPPSVEIGRLTLSRLPFRVLALGDPAEGWRPPYRGLIGHAVFDRLVVRIDQDRGEVVLSDPQDWQYAGAGQPVALDFHGTLPVVEGAIDGVAGRFTLDTGQANSLTLFRPFLRANRLEQRWPPRFTARVAWAIGGDVRAEVARATLLTLGDVRIDRPVLYLSLQPDGAFADPELAGNIGQGVFVRFDVTFAYGRRQAWFERAAGYGRSDDVHMMTLKRSFGGYTVLSVLPGDAAALAGLRPGDVIEEIDGREVAQLEADELQRIFRRGPGTRVALQVRSGGRLRTLVLVLRPSL
jgi:hypothetical protein